MKPILLLAFTSILFNVFTQITFQKTLEADSLITISSTIKTSDGGYISIGITNDGLYERDGAVIKLDTSFNIIWSTALNMNQYTYLSKCIERPSGGYYIVGVAGFNYPYFTGILISLDVNGTFLWSKTYANLTNGYASISDIKIRPNGDLLMSGTQTISGTGRDQWMIYTDSMGVEIWQKTISDQEQQAGGNIVEMQSGNYVISGNYSVANIGHPYLIEIDFNGNIIWAKSYQQFDVQTSVRALKLPDGNLLLVGNQRVDSSLIPNVLAIKLDTSGNVIWSKSYANSNSHFIYDATPTSDSGCILVGDSGTDSLGYHNFAFKIDQNGSPEWAKSYNNSVQSHFSGVLETSTGYLMTGMLSSAVYLVQTDFIGNTGGCNVLDINLIETTITLNQIPIIGNASILSSEFSHTISNIPLSVNESILCYQDVTAFEELTSINKKLVKVIDLMGRETIQTKNVVLIYIYDDGSTERIFEIE